MPKKSAHENPMLHLHLVSDATGETLGHLARAALVRFGNAEVREHVWTLVRSEDHLADIARALEKYDHTQSVVFYTMTKDSLSARLEAICRDAKIPAVNILAPAIHALTRRLGAPESDTPGGQHRVMDAAYFARMQALDFAIRHDDGQGLDGIGDADILLVGVSRSSKTPTSIYLAHRGYKVANYPLVPGIPMPIDDINATARGGLFIAGLIKDPRQLSNIRRSRLASMGEGEIDHSEYADLEKIKTEIAEARKLFTRHHWPVIDVTRRSVEETAASVINLYNAWRDGRGGKSDKKGGRK